MAEINTSSIMIPDISLSNLSVTDLFADIKSLALFVLAMVIYSVFVFKFYLFLSRRDILKLKDYEAAGGFAGFMKFLARVTGHTVQNLVLIPVLVFFWFGVLSILMLLLSRNHTPDTILLSTISIVAAVRITSYYNEDLSKDLAKMIPFALLGIFLVDISYFSLEKSIEVATQLPLYWKQFFYYLVFVVAIEFVMRGIDFLRHGFKKPDNGKE